MTIKSAAQYHDHSSYDRYKLGGHRLDWSNQPRAFKEYAGVNPIPLPGDVRLPEKGLFHLFNEADQSEIPGEMTVEDLSGVLLMAYGLTATARYPEGDFYFRSAASAGALYPTEIYVASGGIKGLENGLYHFAVRPHGLHPLRAENVMGSLASIIPSCASKISMVTFFLTAIFFRSAWKYRDRAYRYHLLDTGHVAENLVLSLRALGLPCQATYDFDDEKANRLLGLDPMKEVVLAAVAVLSTLEPPAAGPAEFPALSERFTEAGRVSGREVDYPAIREIHGAGIRIGMASGPSPDMADALGLSFQGTDRVLRTSDRPHVMGLGDVLFRRRSRRNFVKSPVQWEDMTALVEALCAPEYRISGSTPPWEQMLCNGFLAVGVEGLVPGLYGIDRKNKTYGLIQPGEWGEMTAKICLDQAWLKNAGVHFLFFSNPDVLDRAWGARAYRHVMMSAGRLGERLYLAATARGLGCCGIGAFYDLEAAELLRLKKGGRLLYLVAVGVVKRI
ncbi:MAG: SagB family peptide dehydrogenase [Desulfatiglandales bacterium]